MVVHISYSYCTVCAVVEEQVCQISVHWFKVMTDYVELILLCIVCVTFCNYSSM
jgi:hypothetical protein